MNENHQYKIIPVAYTIKYNIHVVTQYHVYLENRMISQIYDIFYGSSYAMI